LGFRLLFGSFRVQPGSDTQHPTALPTAEPYGMRKLGFSPKICVPWNEKYPGGCTPELDKCWPWIIRKRGRELRLKSSRSRRQYYCPASTSVPPRYHSPSKPPWSRVEGKSEVNLPRIPPLRGTICMGVDSRNHRFAPGLPPGWHGPRYHPRCPHQ